jgi:hypothetical protein
MYRSRRYAKFRGFPAEAELACVSVYAASAAAKTTIGIFRLGHCADHTYNGEKKKAGVSRLLEDPTRLPNFFGSGRVRTSLLTHIEQFSIDELSSIDDNRFSTEDQSALNISSSDRDQKSHWRLKTPVPNISGGVSMKILQNNSGVRAAFN